MTAWLRPLVVAAALGFFVGSACDTELGEGECEDPGASRKCSCADGRASVQTCDAFGTWGTCYCYRPSCGNGEQDSMEQCDDGNLTDGDGCNSSCMGEQPPDGPAGPGPGGGGSGNNGNFGGGGSGASGGNVGGAGNGGTAGDGGAGMGGVANGGAGGN